MQIVIEIEEQLRVWMIRREGTFIYRQVLGMEEQRLATLIVSASSTEIG